jgi:uncharacterized protein
VILPDVNVLVYASRPDAERHADFRRWLEGVIDTEPVIGMPDVVLSGVVRILTHVRVFAKPTPLNDALSYCESLLEQPNVVRLSPGDRHWPIFAGLCRKAEAKGNLISDAYLAALAIEAGATLVTTDRDFARFPGVRWVHPLE